MSRSEDGSEEDLDLSGIDDPQKDKDESKQQVQEMIEMFRMIHENKCDDGKKITAASRKQTLEEIQTLYDELDEQLSLEVYMVRVLRWKTYREDIKYWKIWDKKEEFIRRNSRNKNRNMDRKNRDEDDNNSRSRSRSRSRDRGRNVRRRDRSRERNHNGYGDIDEDRRRKERVK